MPFMKRSFMAGGAVLSEAKNLDSPLWLEATKLSGE